MTQAEAVARSSGYEAAFHAEAWKQQQRIFFRAQLLKARVKLEQEIREEVRREEAEVTAQLESTRQELAASAESLQREEASLRHRLAQMRESEATLTLREERAAARYESDRHRLETLLDLERASLTSTVETHREAMRLKDSEIAALRDRLAVSEESFERMRQRLARHVRSTQEHESTGHEEDDDEDYKEEGRSGGGRPAARRRRGQGQESGAMLLLYRSTQDRLERELRTSQEAVQRLEREARSQQQCMVALTTEVRQLRRALKASSKVAHQQRPSAAAAGDSGGTESSTNHPARRAVFTAASASAAHAMRTGEAAGLAGLIAGLRSEVEAALPPPPSPPSMPTARVPYVVAEVPALAGPSGTSSVLPQGGNASTQSDAYRKKGKASSAATTPSHRHRLTPRHSEDGEVAGGALQAAAAPLSNQSTTATGAAALHQVPSSSPTSTPLPSDDSLTSSLDLSEHSSLERRLHSSQLSDGYLEAAFQRHQGHSLSVLQQEKQMEPSAIPPLPTTTGNWMSAPAPDAGAAGRFLSLPPTPQDCEDGAAALSPRDAMRSFLMQLSLNRERLLQTGVYSPDHPVVKEMEGKIQSYTEYLTEHGGGGAAGGGDSGGRQ